MLYIPHVFRRIQDMSKICLDMLYLSNILPYYPAIVTQNLYVMYVSWNFTKSYDFSIEKLNHFSFINYALVIESISYQYLQWSRLYYISFCVLVVGKVGNSFAGRACFLQLDIKEYKKLSRSYKLRQVACDICKISLLGKYY